MKKDVPLHKKYALTLEEAAAYTGIGINRLRALTDLPGTDLVLWVGSKRLIRRIAIERYLETIDTL